MANVIVERTYKRVISRKAVKEAFANNPVYAYDTSTNLLTIAGKANTSLFLVKGYIKPEADATLTILAGAKTIFSIPLLLAETYPFSLWSMYYRTDDGEDLKVKFSGSVVGAITIHACRA